MTTQAKTRPAETINPKHAYVNEKGELAPPHCVGTDEDGNKLYLVPEGWEPTFGYELNEDGLAVAGD